MISLDQQIAEVQRELKQRGRVYGRQVAIGRMNQDAADKQLERMQAVLETLIRLKNAPAQWDAVIKRQEQRELG